MFPRVAFLNILTERCPFTVVWEMFESCWRRFQVESEEHEGESRLSIEHLATRGGLTVKKGSDCHHGRGFASRIGWENRSDPFSRFFESLAALPCGGHFMTQSDEPRGDHSPDTDGQPAIPVFTWRGDKRWCSRVVCLCVSQKRRLCTQNAPRVGFRHLPSLRVLSPLCGACRTAGQPTGRYTGQSRGKC